MNIKTDMSGQNLGLASSKTRSWLRLDLYILKVAMWWKSSF